MFSSSASAALRKTLTSRCLSSATSSGNGVRRRPAPFPQLEVVSPSAANDAAAASESRAKAANEAHEKLSAYCRAGGGKRGMERHTVKNKKVFVRERIRAIVDEGAEIFELGLTAGLGLDYGNIPCAGGITCIAPINGVSVMILGNDATVKGGTRYTTV